MAQGFNFYSDWLDSRAMSDDAKRETFTRMVEHGFNMSRIPFRPETVSWPSDDNFRKALILYANDDCNGVMFRDDPFSIKMFLQVEGKYNPQYIDRAGCVHVGHLYFAETKNVFGMRLCVNCASRRPREVLLMHVSHEYSDPRCVLWEYCDECYYKPLFYELPPNHCKVHYKFHGDRPIPQIPNPEDYEMEAALERAYNALSDDEVDSRTSSDSETSSDDEVEAPANTPAEYWNEVLDMDHAFYEEDLSDSGFETCSDIENAVPATIPESVNNVDFEVGYVRPFTPIEFLTPNNSDDEDVPNPDYKSDDEEIPVRPSNKRSACGSSESDDQLERNSKLLTERAILKLLRNLECAEDSDEEEKPKKRVRYEAPSYHPLQEPSRRRNPSYHPLQAPRRRNSFYNLSDSSEPEVVVPYHSEDSDDVSDSYYAAGIEEIDSYRHLTAMVYFDGDYCKNFRMMRRLAHTRGPRGILPRPIFGASE